MIAREQPGAIVPVFHELRAHSASEAILVDALERELRVREEDGNGLRCAECGEVDDGERGWTLRLDVDRETVAFCPECDRREFGNR